MEKFEKQRLRGREKAEACQKRNNMRRCCALPHSLSLSLPACLSVSFCYCCVARTHAHAHTHSPTQQTTLNFCFYFKLYFGISFLTFSTAPTKFMRVFLWFGYNKKKRNSTFHINKIILKYTRKFGVFLLYFLFFETVAKKTCTARNTFAD